MAKEYRYSLEQRGKLHVCVSCGKKRMTRYVDKETNAYLPEKYGRCARLNNCAYHLNPYHDGYGKMDMVIEEKAKKKQPVSFLPIEVLEQTYKGYDLNVFVEGLKSKTEEWKEIINLYRLGTITGGSFKGATTFPYIDRDFNVRTIQTKLFGEEQTEIKSIFLHEIYAQYYKSQKVDLPEWLTNAQKNDENTSCLFGEHLLNKFPNNPVALVDDLTKAIYGTIQYGLPKNETEFVFLAEENLTSLNYQKCAVLKGRKITLFPVSSDQQSVIVEWEKRAKTFEQNIEKSSISVSDVLIQV